MPEDSTGFAQTLANVTRFLLQARNAAGHWEGKLSSSALSTATAIFALHSFLQDANGETDADTRRQIGEQVQHGVAWLNSNQNSDGGWGDTVLSRSNISTTALCWAALSSDSASVATAVQKAQGWLVSAAGSLEHKTLATAIKLRYGKDQTFSVPILTMCALAGRMGPGRDAWRCVPQLPFELAACPQQWFQWLQLPVVSYALPALIAIGQVRHALRPTRNPLLRAMRDLARGRTLRLLEQIQPEGGGFLEATPLTSFVVMSLVGSGHARHPVTRNGIAFLRASMRDDGSWPIDTNLSTWVTALAVSALAASPGFDHALPAEQRQKIADWLLKQQYRTVHRYTQAPPGAWAWTDLPGGVPDADDTAGALLALWRLGHRDERTLAAVEAGVVWLLNIQNRDGGIPTFCRGWGKLPFDRSGSDLTAHALHAWMVWRSSLKPGLQQRIDAGMNRGRTFLHAQQRPDGSWAPLWFGNQFAADETNTTYGTSKVLTALCGSGHENSASDSEMLRRGAGYLVQTQNVDGGWGSGKQTPSSIEETSLAAAALAAWYPQLNVAERQPIANAVRHGLHWLETRTGGGREFSAAPIGLYFAKLWYFERDYPAVYCAAAFGISAKTIGK